MMVHDTYQIVFKDGNITFVEVAITEKDNGNYAFVQNVIMNRIFKSLKEQGYEAKDVDMIVPINSTDPEAREVIRETRSAMERLDDFFKNGGDLPDGE
jgi:hypothetical protein